MNRFPVLISVLTTVFLSGSAMATTKAPVNKTCGVREVYNEKRGRCEPVRRPRTIRVLVPSRDPKHRTGGTSTAPVSKSSVCYVSAVGGDPRDGQPAGADPSGCTAGTLTKFGCALGGTTTSEYYTKPDCKVLAKSTVCWVGEVVIDAASAKNCQVGKRLIVDGGVPACEVKNSKPDTVFAYDNHCRIQKGMIPSGTTFETPQKGYSKGEADRGGGFGTGIPPGHVRSGKTIKPLPSEVDGGTGGPCAPGQVFDRESHVCRVLEKKAGNGG